MTPPPAPPLVLHRDRDWLRKQLLWRLGIALLGLALAVVMGGLPTVARVALGVLGLGLALRPSRDLHRTVTLDARGLRRGFGRWPWSALTSVEPAPPTGPSQGLPLGSLTLRFGDRAVGFGREWPLEALLVEALARAPLEAQLARALDRKEREHGLDFGVLRLGPRFLDLRREGRTARRVALQDVREVALELTAHQAELRLEAEKRHLEVPLAEVNDPHVLATLLVRQASRGSTATVPLTVKHPPPTDATAPRPEPATRRRWRLSGVNPLGVFAILGSLFFLIYGIDVWTDARASREWRPVEAEILTAGTWEAPATYGRKKRMVEHGYVSYRFVLDGVEYQGKRVDVDGSEPSQARRYHVGQKVTAYVPADNPRNAVLSQKVPGFSVLFILIGASFAGVGLWFTYASATSRR